MSRTVSRAEAWSSVYEAFQTVNFASYDYNTIKQSLLDYIKLYFPEAFNDFIESSEFIAILEMFAYMGEQLAYRVDMNTHENFLTTAQRKESVLRLAKLISYSPSRNIPARGLVKLTSIQTSEAVFDSLGRNLSNKKIVWNDINNTNWKEQFLIVVNKVIQQEFGSVKPSERVQVGDILFELYSLNNTPLSSNGPTVFSYSTTVSGTSLGMELVPVTLDQYGPLEKRPEVNVPFTLLYGSDGLGDSSNTTGFFCFTKQGTLKRFVSTFDGVTPNQVQTINDTNINDTDVWVNNVDSSLQIIDDLTNPTARSGEWVEVDLSHAQNIIFNTNTNRHKYEIETTANDGIKLIFGDGEFADVPSGDFHIWYRTSQNDNIVIPQNAISEKTATFTYLDSSNNTQTCAFTFSSIGTIQNNSKSEDIEHIRSVAPSVYYTQDRMVNGRDYNTFMLQDPSIIKLRAVNRTFSGDSKYLYWHDPAEYYENVKLVGDDLVLYYDTKTPDKGLTTVINTPISVNELLIDYIQPLLSSMDFFNIIGAALEAAGHPASSMRKIFRLDELTDIGNELNLMSSSATIYYSITNDHWTISPYPYTPTYPDSIAMMIVTKTIVGSILAGWTIQHASERLIIQSESTKFWNTNTTSRVITYDSLNSNMDTIQLLKANTNASGTGILSRLYSMDVLGIELLDQNLPNAGLIDIHRMSVTAHDVNGDHIPDQLTYPEIFDYTKTYTLVGGADQLITLESGKYLANLPTVSNDITVYQLIGVTWTAIPYGTTLGSTWSIPLTEGNVATKIQLNGNWAANEIKIVMNSYVYFYRTSVIDRWIPIKSTVDNVNFWVLDQNNININTQLYTRHIGRDELNFMWFHRTDQFNLVDPSATNIIDSFIITKGYYTAVQQYLAGYLTTAPIPPTPNELLTSYAKLIDNKMISDTLILHPGTLKLLFGPHASAELQATFKVIRPSSNKSLTDNQVKVKIVDVVKTFFDINKWEFGETFYFSELTTVIHANLGSEIDSVVLVPLYANNQFGDLYQIGAGEDEILFADITIDQIEFVNSYTPLNIRQ
jgi:hypothetical protein